MLLIDFATFLEDIELDRRYGKIRRTSAIWEQKDQMLNMSSDSSFPWPVAHDLTS